MLHDPEYLLVDIYRGLDSVCLTSNFDLTYEILENKCRRRVVAVSKAGVMKCLVIRTPNQVAFDLQPRFYTWDLKSPINTRQNIAIDTLIR